MQKPPAEAEKAAIGVLLSFSHAWSLYERYCVKLYGEFFQKLSKFPVQELNY